MNNREPRYGIIYITKSLTPKQKKVLKWIFIVFVILLILSILFIFVVLPLIFMNSIGLQRLLMFTNLGLPHDKGDFIQYEIIPGIRNLYVSVLNNDNNSPIHLGVWHLLPYSIANDTIDDIHYDYDKALRSSEISVVLYFHGTGETRISSLDKYMVFRNFFHVITFDYRSYGDSDKATLSEDGVVSDCLQLYYWLANKTEAPIYVWGHSLGSALATRTVAELKSHSRPVGLILESAFTNMRDEISVHPYGKFLAWLPWFEQTVLNPLEKNGFIFGTNRNILNIECPVMILTAEDDGVVPYHFGQRLNEIASNRSLVNTTVYFQFPSNFRYNHNFIYEDEYLPYFINYFIYICTNQENVNLPQPL